MWICKEERISEKSLKNRPGRHLLLASTEPDKHCFVGITMDRPAVKPVENADKGIPITVSTTIDELPKLLKLLGRV